MVCLVKGSNSGQGNKIQEKKTESKESNWELLFEQWNDVIIAGLVLLDTEVLGYPRTHNRLRVEQCVLTNGYVQFTC